MMSRHSCVAAELPDILSPARSLLSMKLLDYFTMNQLRNRGRYREMARFRSNQTLELTATRRAFTFQHD